MGEVHGLAPHAGSFDSSGVHKAWERFVAGGDDVVGVRPEVAISWQRCRDQYQVDPYLSSAPVAVAEDTHPLEHDVVFAELGFRAAAMAHEVASIGGIVVVADGSGRVLAEWGDKGTRALAAETGLAPWHCWSEMAVGTNGMGTALAAQKGVVTVRREEHWCQSVHDWTCAGVTVRDVVTRKPVAALNVSCWRSDLPDAAPMWLRTAAATTQSRLRSRARDGGAELLAAHSHALARSHAPVVAVDTAGKVVIADDRASVLLGVPGNTPALEPAVRWTSQLPALQHVAEYASKEASDNPDWTGSTLLHTHLTHEPVPAGVSPVFLYGSLVGHVISFGPSDGEPVPSGDGLAPPGGAIRRVVGMRENRMVILKSAEVVLAESDGSDVWLSTDDGRLLAASPGLDRLDHELSGAGFLRAHRRYVVNLNRVREVERGEKGELVLVMDDPARTTVPVSRRNGRAVRRALGI